MMSRDNIIAAIISIAIIWAVSWIAVDAVVDQAERLEHEACVRQEALGIGFGPRFPR